MGKPSTDNMASFSDDDITRHGSEADDERQANSLYGSLASKLSTAPEPTQDKTMGMTSNPLMSLAEISGKIPKKSSMGGKDDVDNYSNDVQDDVSDDDFSDNENAQSRGGKYVKSHTMEISDNIRNVKEMGIFKTRKTFSFENCTNTDSYCTA
jgi:hypothetical protein